MFYLGMRSSDRYLARLASIREGRTPCDVLTVAGGVAFLHAISTMTTSLTIVDVDPDTLSHWSLIRALIAESSSLTDFLTLLGGRVATGSFDEHLPVFGPPVDVRPRLSSALSATDLTNYDRTYGDLTVDEMGVGYHPAFTVRFVGMDFRHRTFNWRFGLGNLADEAHFQELRSRLLAVPTRTCLARLEALDFDADYPSGKSDHRARVCLASNCESPMFTPADAIFLRALKTARAPVRYVSWLRDVILADGVALDAPPDEGPAPTTHPADSVVFVADGHEAADLGVSFRRSIRSLDELRDQPEYGRARIVLLGHPEAGMELLLAAIAPAYREVVWVPAAGATPRSVGFSLPNYHRAHLGLAFGGRPVWFFQLVGCP